MDPNSLLDLVPHATIVPSEASGHIPDVEDPSAFVQLVRSMQ